MYSDLITAFSYLTPEQLVALVALSGLCVAGFALYVVCLALKARKP
jgi:hypothetical protein